jgi:hypothetical protein
MNIKTDLIEFEYHNDIKCEINIKKELYRGELYCELLKNFTKSCLNNFNENVFSHKKNYTRTITNLLASWFFTLYQTYNFSKDPFFPNNYLECDDIIIRILKDYVSLHEIDNVNEKINNIIIDLHSNYELLLNKLDDINNKIIKYNNFKIIKQEISNIRNNKNILFYNFILSNINCYICNKLNNIISNIMIPIEQYNIMKEKFNGEYEDDIDTLIWIILYRYQLLSSNNNQLAVLPKIYEKMSKDFNLSVECFASAINSSSNYYCSLYYDVEKYFGSIGNFFNINLKKGVYSFNPPYQFDVITNGIHKIINHMNNSDEKLVFIITIPIWDNHGKEYMANNMMENNNNTIKYDDFNIINTIKESKFFRGLRMISKDEFTYMDHNFFLFKNKTIQNTYVIVMSNKECDYINTINNYNFYN